MCVQKILVPPHPRPHTCSHHPFLYTCVYTGLVFLHWPDLFTLPACVHSCLHLSIPVHPVYAAHACSHLPIPVLSDNYPCSSLALHLPLLLPAPAHTYFAPLFLCSGPGQRELGCSEAEGAPPAEDSVLPSHDTTSAQGAAHGVGAGASRGGCVTGGVWEDLDHGHPALGMSS